RVLLHKPKEWRTDKLDELRQKLTSAAFRETDLQKAHEVVHHKALADIISMVKHAAKAEEPILTAEERVDRALKRVKGSKNFSVDQNRWLGLIREHLVKNLTIELDDFRQLQVFERHGVLARARKVFDQQLEPLVEQINEALAT